MIEVIARDIRSKFLKNDSLNTNEFNEFKEKYPKFFKMLTTSDMDESMFEKLFEMFNKVSNSNTDSFSAAGEFSQYGATKYMYDTFGKPSQDDIDKASIKLKKQFNK